MPGFDISKHNLSVFKVHMSSLVSISAHIVSKLRVTTYRARGSGRNISKIENRFQVYCCFSVAVSCGVTLLENVSCVLLAVQSSLLFFSPSSLVEQRGSVSILPGHCFSYAWEGAKVFGMSRKRGMRVM